MPAIKFNFSSATAKQLFAGASLLACVGLATAAEPTIAYENTTSTHVLTFIRGADPVQVKTLQLNLAKPSKVLVTFTSSITAESSAGCPCSVRATLAMDGEEPRIVKRINVGSPAVQEVDKYQWDRQSLDGSSVFEAPAGKHTFTLTFRQAGSSAQQLEVNYPNIQAIAFQ